MSFASSFSADVLRYYAEGDVGYALRVSLRHQVKVFHKIEYAIFVMLMYFMSPIFKNLTTDYRNNYQR